MNCCHTGRLWLEPPSEYVDKVSRSEVTPAHPGLVGHAGPTATRGVGLQMLHFASPLLQVSEQPQQWCRKTCRGA